MRQLAIPPDAHTFPFVIKACTHSHDLLLGRILHSQVIKFGFRYDIFVYNTLITFYSNSNCLNDAHKLFEESPERDVVSYNALINGFVKAGDISGARKVFDKMPVKDDVSWGTLVTGYAQTNQCDEAIELFNSMSVFGVKPDNVALVSVLSACSQCGALEQGKAIHDYIKRHRIVLNAFLLTAMVDMYAKCGCINIAREIFDSSLDNCKNLFTWNAMLVGLSMHGRGELALEYFSKMTEARVQPDGVSFLGVLVGCSHVGLVDKARQIFNEMESVYRVQRELKHYGCMADLLGRAGLIQEVMEMIERMPMKGDVFVWGGLLGGCRIHGNVEIAELAAQHIMELEPEDGGVYQVMANIYANRRRWEDVSRMRTLMNCRKQLWHYKLVLRKEQDLRGLQEMVVLSGIQKGGQQKYQEPKRAERLLMARLLKGYPGPAGLGTIYSDKREQ
ncbi:Pentatricopeptide repeat-containing protein [Thalictrum thalictroides]|uniref:Pentatricopeptide repeat-containing protein n=1 Tax=Thalictrum thalictroides TaxID=46969 RepID=A0A7J6VKZ0_THATH|nr:Pentatricopeptide repeat-containing protein [Thalictrum thalictroides]